MGLFGVAEVFTNLETGKEEVLQTKITNIWPSIKTTQTKWSLARGSVLVFCSGSFPAGAHPVRFFPMESKRNSL
jgi:TctA family transporter